MRYFQVIWDNVENTEFFVFERAGPDLKDTCYKLYDGEPFGDEYPKAARVYMSSDFPGMKLPDFVSNMNGALMVSRKVKESIQAIQKAPTEYLPAVIYNHKKRVASQDYFFINPLGTVDCLHLKKSKIEWHKKDVVDVEEAVLDKRKLKDLPDLFRVREKPHLYVASWTLVKAWIDMDPRPTNCFVEELEQA